MSERTNETWEQKKRRLIAATERVVQEQQACRDGDGGVCIVCHTFTAHRHRGCWCHSQCKKHINQRLIERAMMTKTNEINCSPDVWKQLIELHDKRKREKSELDDNIRLRKTIEEDLRGSKKGTKPYTKLTADHWETLEAIELGRAHIRTLADQMEATIKDGIQGKLYEVGPLDEEPKEDAPLYENEESDEDEEEQPIGQKSPAPKPELKPTRSLVPPPAWHDFDVETLIDYGMSDAAVAKLKQNEWATIGQVLNRQPACRLTTRGITPAQEAIFEKAIDSLREGRDPDAESDGEDEEKPAAGKKKKSKKSTAAA